MYNISLKPVRNLVTQYQCLAHRCFDIVALFSGHVLVFPIDIITFHGQIIFCCCVFAHVFWPLSFLLNFISAPRVEGALSWASYASGYRPWLFIWCFTEVALRPTGDPCVRCYVSVLKYEEVQQLENAQPPWGVMKHMVVLRAGVCWFPLLS